MKAARKSGVVGVNCDDNGMLNVEFAKINEDDPVIFYSPPTNTSFGEGPRVPDPYEQKYAKLAQSTVPNSGEGVIAKTDLPADFTACFYAAYIQRNKEEALLYALRYVTI